MELRLKKRDVLKKSATKRARAMGDIPAVLYGKGQDNQNVMVDGKAFRKHLQTIPKGQLATQVFDGEIEGTKVQILVKDISYHRVTYQIQHLDLQVVQSEDSVLVHIPVVYKGEDRCPGVTQGGYIKLVRRSVPVQLPVKELKPAFELDVSRLNLGDSLRIQDLALTEHMCIHLDQKLVLLTIGK